MIPIRTDIPVRRTPLANYVIISANIAVFLAVMMSRSVAAWCAQHLVFYAHDPAWYQYFTYQFLHARESVWHILGNMIFLWVFGNPVNARMGNLAYGGFYLVGGAFAAWGYSLFQPNPLIGASGAVAAVTTAFLVMFPRSRVRFLLLFIIITFVDLPSLLIITIKIILWDNIIAPSLSGGGASNVAYSAHLFGYAYGFVVTIGLMYLRVVPRDYFDLPSLLKRWRQREAYRALLERQRERPRGPIVPVAPSRPQPEPEPPPDPRRGRLLDLRRKISEAFRQEDRALAASLYQQLMLLDEDAVLDAARQLDVANQLYLQDHHTEAARAYELFLKHYPMAAEADHVRLMLGILYARELQAWEAAEKHLRASLERLNDEKRVAQCRAWLRVVLGRLGKQPEPGL